MADQLLTRSGEIPKCPSCGEPLVPVLTDGVEVDACAKCGGVWVEFMDEKTFLSMHPEVFTADMLRRLRRFYSPVEKMEPIRYRKCPVCNDVMHRRNWGSTSGVIVDQCEIDGTWFDPGEADKVREFVKCGGIEYEKLGYRDAEILDLKDRVTREVKRLDQRITLNSARGPAWARFMAGMMGINPF